MNFLKAPTSLSHHSFSLNETGKAGLKACLFSFDRTIFYVLIERLKNQSQNSRARGFYYVNGQKFI